MLNFCDYEKLVLNFLAFSFSFSPCYLSLYYKWICYVVIPHEIINKSVFKALNSCQFTYF